MRAQALLGIGNLNVEKLSIMGGITPDQLKLIVTRCLGHLVHLELYDVPKATLAILPDALAQRRAEFVHKTLETLVVHDLSGIDTKIAKSLADLDGRHKVAYRHFEIDLNHPLELSQNVMVRLLPRHSTYPLPLTCLIHCRCRHASTRWYA